MEKMDNEELTTTFKRGQRHNALDLSLYTVFLALFLYCFFFISFTDQVYVGVVALTLAAVGI